MAIPGETRESRSGQLSGLARLSLMDAGWLQRGGKEATRLVPSSRPVRRNKHEKTRTGQVRGQAFFRKEVSSRRRQRGPEMAIAYRKSVRMDNGLPSSGIPAVQFFIGRIPGRAGQ